MNGLVKPGQLFAFEGALVVVAALESESLAWIGLGDNARLVLVESLAFVPAEQVLPLLGFEHKGWGLFTIEIAARTIGLFARNGHLDPLWQDRPILFAHQLQAALARLEDYILKKNLADIP